MGMLRCKKPRWAGHPTRYCYQHAIAFGDARVVDQAAVDLLLAAERRATVERIRAALKGRGFSPISDADMEWIGWRLDEEAAR